MSTLLFIVHLYLQNDSPKQFSLFVMLEKEQS